MLPLASQAGPSIPAVNTFSFVSGVATNSFSSLSAADASRKNPSSRQKDDHGSLMATNPFATDDGRFSATMVIVRPAVESANPPGSVRYSAAASRGLGSLAVRKQFLEAIRARKARLEAAQQAAQAAAPREGGE